MKIYYLFLILILATCSCQKQKGCTDRSSLNYNSDAEQNDGSCAYLSGTYVISETCDGAADHYSINIPENGVNFSIHNFANLFESVSAWRNGLMITINSQSVQDKNGFHWDVSGGGTISANGKTIYLTYTVDGSSCSATGSK